MTYNNDDCPTWGIRARRRKARMQPTLRTFATYIGNFKTCKLPKCRRARQCLGCHPADEIGTTHWKSFPPCVDSDEKQAALVRGSKALVEEGRRALRADGVDMEEWYRTLYDGPDPFDDPE